MQSRKLSFIEAVVNMTTGYAVGMILNYIIYLSIFKIQLSITTNFTITLLFTLASLIRVYIIRRIFNSIGEKC